MMLVCCVAGRASAQEMVRIPGGSVKLGSKRGDPDERPVHRVKLRAFLMDRQEVIQAHYRRCVSSGGCTVARKYEGQIGPQLPVIGVTWRQAAAYCRWAGKRLPTEAEWERAARGPLGREYPWGEEADCRRANYGNFAGAGPCAGINPGGITPVGQRPTGRTPEGVEDLAGNVWEWVQDDYAPYPKGKGGKGRKAARKGKGEGAAKKVVRGGSCCSYFVLPRGANRLAFPPGYRDRDLGFRCAKGGE